MAKLRSYVGWYLMPVILTGLFIAGCVVQKSPVSGKKRAYGYSWEEELRIGREADQQIQQQYGVYQDENVVKYVESVGQEVLSVSHMRREDTPEQYRKTDFHFRVLNSPIVNAFALPGGYVYVTRGLLSHLNNEAQLAVVLGHEIGHVAARHASQRAFEQKLGQIAVVGGAIAGQELLGLPGQNLLNLGGTAAQLLFLQYSRDDERESDQLGVEYAAMQRYMAAEGAEFFTSLKRISNKSGQSIPSFLSTHPEPGEREKTIPKMAEEWRQKGYEQSILDKEQYMNYINGMIFGDNPREGFTRDGTFYHPDLKFKFPYPAGWTLINQATQVAVINDDQDAVIILRIDSESQSARASVQEILGQEGIQVLRQSSTQSNGLPAYEASARAQTQDGTSLSIYLFAVEFGDNIYRFINYTTTRKYDDYESRFIESTRGFSELGDASILSIQPVRLNIVETNRSGTFESFLPETLPMDITAEEMAIVNQVHLGDRVEAGTMLKIPVQKQ